MTITNIETSVKHRINYFVDQTNGMKPLLKWSGGKYDELKYIRPYCLNHNEVSLYIEPFVGAGAVFFDREYDKNVISDVHSDLVNFYQQIKNGNSKNIYNLVLSFPITEEGYYHIRDNYKPINDVELAARFYYLRKTCFRGMLRYNKAGEFNIPFGRYKSINIEDLLNDNYEKLLAETEVLRASFEELFEKYNDESHFVFLDPPYDSKFVDYGYCSFDRDLHVKLANYIKASKNKCLMVIGETDFIKNLYKDYIVDRYHKKYRFKIYGGRVGNEINNTHLIVKNY